MMIGIEWDFFWEDTLPCHPTPLNSGPFRSKMAVTSLGIDAGGFIEPPKGGSKRDLEVLRDTFVRHLGHPGKINPPNILENIELLGLST